MNKRPFFNPQLELLIKELNWLLKFSQDFEKWPVVRGKELITKIPEL